MDLSQLIVECERRLRGNEQALQQAEAHDFRMVVYRRGSEGDETDAYRQTLRENIALEQAILQQLASGYRYVS